MWCQIKLHSIEYNTEELNNKILRYWRVKEWVEVLTGDWGLRQRYLRWPSRVYGIRQGWQVWSHRLWGAVGFRMTFWSCTARGGGPIRLLRVGHIAIGQPEAMIVVVVVVVGHIKGRKRKVTMRILLWQWLTRDFSYAGFVCSMLYKREINKHKTCRNW